MTVNHARRASLMIPDLAMATRNTRQDSTASPDIAPSLSPSTQSGNMMIPTAQPRSRWRISAATLITSLLITSAPALVAAECISLKGSTTCQAFQSSSVSTDNPVVGYFPFMQYVSDVTTFDQQLRGYVSTSYVQDKYQSQFGCGGIDLSNTTELYARFTMTTICNSIIQNSINACNLSAAESEPVCAETCAQFAQSVELVTSDNNLCSNPNSGVTDLIRAEFTTCALPVNSLSTSNCVAGAQNEPDNCGFGESIIGLCSYCAAGGINSTDTCCYSAGAENRCRGVVLPSIMPSLSLPSATPSPSNATVADPGQHGGHKLSGGAIAGIVIGAVAGLLLLGAALFFCCFRRRRHRRDKQKGNILNQPSPPRSAGGGGAGGGGAVGAGDAGGAGMEQRRSAPQGFEVLPGGRIARMSALEGRDNSGDSGSRNGGTTAATAVTAAAAVAAGTAAAGHRRRDNNTSSSSNNNHHHHRRHSSSDQYGDSPGSESRVAGVLRPPPTTIRRHSSVSSQSQSQLDPQSPGGMSHGVASQQSEQLPFFKDYYSQDDIHPSDKVAVLWAYQPRAADEFSLERGDMLKVVGIWDDGWATGVLLDERAEEWESRRQAQRDSGVSNTTARRDSSPPTSGEIKAFPLVCVCLPEHWRKTIEGDGSTDAASVQY